MSAGPSLPPLRVEQALRLLPDVDALALLRAFLISTSRVRTKQEPYLTIGKRQVDPVDLRERIPLAADRVAEHVAALYEIVVEALEHEEHGDLPAAVRALLRAGEREERVGRAGQTRTWYSHALRIAQGLRDRGPEIEALRHLGELESRAGRFDEAARLFQRSLALADAERYDHDAALASHGLAEAAMAQARWQGAESWYGRALEYAKQDETLTARIYLGLGELARQREQDDLAEGYLQRAREMFEALEDTQGTIRVLNAVGLLEARRGHRPEALAHYREGLARLLHPDDRSAALEITIRLNVCQLFVDWQRLPDADDEARRAEETAIAHSLTHCLARIYTMMGKIRALQHDDGGFVFYEKAIELCRERDPSPVLEAEVYLEYGLFQKELGSPEDARAYLERAREILERVEDGRMLERVDRELNRIVEPG